jgi:hypothetical protein
VELTAPDPVCRQASGYQARDEGEGLEADQQQRDGVSNWW